MVLHYPYSKSKAYFRFIILVLMFKCKLIVYWCTHTSHNALSLSHNSYKARFWLYEQTLIKHVSFSLFYKFPAKKPNVLRSKSIPIKLYILVKNLKISIKMLAKARVPKVEPALSRHSFSIGIY